MSDQDDFFVGWAAKPPAMDRRFFFAAGLGLVGASAGAGFLLSSRQNGGGTGTWPQGDVREWRGRVTSSPYPMMRVLDEDGTVRTALLGCLNKCAPALRIDQYGDQEVIVRGSPIRRGPHLMIATQDDGSWIEAAPGTSNQDFSFPDREGLGTAELRGTILDTKCWFGAMQPGEGKVHKACASLCIRSGLPPAFYVKSLKDQEHLLIMTTQDGAAVSQEVLPFVADPLSLRGQIERLGDVLFLKTDVTSFERLKRRPW